MAIKQGKKLTGMEGAIEAQRETTESVDRLNIKFKSFMDSMSRNQLDLLEALREQKKEDSAPVKAQPSSAKLSEDSSSSNGFLGKLLGLVAPLGAILGKVAVAVAALEALLRMRPDRADFDWQIGENGPTVNTAVPAVALTSIAAKTAAAKLTGGYDRAKEKNRLIDEAREKQAKGPGKNYTINKNGVAISNTTGKPLSDAAQKAIKASGTAALANQSKMANIIKGLVKSLGAQTLKAVPVAGLAAAAAFAVDRALKGDYAGAVLDVGTGIAAALPGAGTALAVSGIVASVARDAYNSVYGTAANPYPVEDDLLNDPKGTAAKMGEITSMVAEEMKKAAGGVAESAVNAMSAAPGVIMGSQVPATKDGGGVQPSASAVATDSLVTTGNSTGASLDAMNMEYAFNNSSAMQPPVVIDASNNVTSSGGGGGGSSVPMMPINPVGNVGSNRDGFYFPQYLSMVS